MIYKKGILWLPNIEIIKLVHNELRIHNVDIYKSYSGYDKDDEIFKNQENNCLMLACDKFTTGSDIKNMEFGVNFHINQSGHILIQKLVRFTRKNK